MDNTLGYEPGDASSILAGGAILSISNTNAGVLLGEDSAFQADGEGSNPFARSKISGPTPVSE
jgi:hypothetical protein